MSDNYFNIDADLASENNANLNAPALQLLIDGVAAAGGGTITIPPGIYAINGTIAARSAGGLAILHSRCEGSTLVRTAATEVPLFGIGAGDGRVRPRRRRNPSGPRRKGTCAT
jgi:polygalacturonase